MCGTFLLHTTKDVDLPMEAFAQLLVRGSTGSSSTTNGMGLGAGAGSGPRVENAAEDGLELGSIGTPKTALRRGPR